MGQNIIRNNQPLFDLVAQGKRTILSASLNQQMLSDDTVSLKVASSTVLDIKINDTIVVYGEVYRINSLPSVDKKSNSYYEYDIQAQGLMYDLLRCKFFNADSEGYKPDIDFPLTGTIEVFLTCLKNNMSRLSDLWQIGNFANGETKTLTFGNDNCLSALQKICSEFKTDFWVKFENDKFVIHTGDFGNTLPVTFEYGKGNGLYSLSRKNVNDNEVVNRLYAFGGSNNIPAGYRDFSPKLKLPGAEYLEDINLIKDMGLKEGILEFEDIYPKRMGKITAILNSKYKFQDDTMDFDLNEKEADGVTTKYLIAGTSAKVHFNTGNLAGYEFEIKKGGYDHATKTFEIIPFKNDKDQSFPDPESEAFQFAVDDEYVILDIVMPQTYIDNAEQELLEKATEQFDLYKQAKVSYDLEIDPEYIKKLSLQDSLKIGDYVRVVDQPLGIDKVLRINQITRNFIENGERNDYDFKIVIADGYEIDYNSQMILDIKDIKNVMSITDLGTVNFSRIGVKTTEELKNLTFDPDGYFDADNIRPGSIETGMISVGSRSQQISLSSVFYVNVDGVANKVTINPGVLYSQTMEKTWIVSGNTIVLPDNNWRYVYGKCSKFNDTGSVVLTQTKIMFDEDPGYYHFLIGILHSVTDGLRVLSITIGTTTINGGLVRTGIISSLDMQTYFNLDNGEIKGKIKFLNGSDGFTSINGGVLMSQVIEVGNATTKNAFISSTTDAGDTTGTSIRFGAGKDYANRNTAPFRVQHNGKMIAENADIKGKIDALSGSIGGVDGWSITTSTLTSTAGRILFGTLDQFGMLTTGVTISGNNFPNSTTYKNRFQINSFRNEGNINNVGSVISASGNNIDNTAIDVGASGGTNNNAIYVRSGNVYVSSSANLIFEAEFNAIATNYTFAGATFRRVGYTGVKTVGGVNMHFSNGLLVMTT